MTMDDNERAAYWQGAFERMAARNYELSETNTRMQEALKAMLRHSCVADAAPEDKDSEDHQAERLARTAISKATLSPANPLQEKRS